MPTAQPPRPQGVERNVVVTLWDWATPKAYLHDEISTDRRNPTVNAHGLIYGSPELSTDFVPIVDPMKNATSQVKLPVRDPKTPNTADDPILAASPYWGMEAIWNGQANIHNPMLDAQGPGLVYRQDPSGGRPGILQVRDRTSPPRSCSRCKGPGDRLRCTIRNPASSR